VVRPPIAKPIDATALQVIDTGRTYRVVHWPRPRSGEGSPGGEVPVTVADETLPERRRPDRDEGPA
jgi:hypothetical protein